MSHGFLFFESFHDRGLELVLEDGVLEGGKKTQKENQLKNVWNGLDFPLSTVHSIFNKIGKKVVCSIAPRRSLFFSFLNKNVIKVE